MKKSYLILLNIFLILASVSCTFASDDINDTVNENSDNVQVDNPTVQVTIDENDNIDNTNMLGTLGGNTTPGSYDDLNDDIQNINSGDTFDFIRDYEFDADGVPFLDSRVIVINQDNIIINGNGHTIDAGGLDNFAIFNVLGNNVVIKNLKFINSIPSSIHGPNIKHTEYRKIPSPISWEGNSGTIQNCEFYNNRAVNGGTISWTGNNGKIDNCSFENSTATGVGGAIYIGGINNTISNCQFYNSTSLLSDVIYADRNRKNLSFINDTIGGLCYIVDGSISNIDVDYLYYSHTDYAYGNISTHHAYTMNIVPFIFKAIVTGVTNNNDYFKYNSLYNNMTGDFTFNIFGYDEVSASNYALDYLKSIHIKSNITDLNQVFPEIFNENYEYSISQILITYVSNAEDYEKLNQYNSPGLWFNEDGENDITSNKKLTTLNNGLKIVFKDSLTINSATTFNPKDKGFDVITIMGNDSRIMGGAEDRDEKKWLEMDASDKIIVVNDLTIQGFNTAVECLQGTCYFNNVNFDYNRMDYLIDRDWGAGILNTGVVVCNNCTFTNNYAKNGGAIFNQGYLSLDNCTFVGNTAYGEGNNVCVGDGGIVVINGKNITSNTDIVHIAESMSSTKSFWLTIASYAASFVVGFFAGIITANPVIGMVVGTVLGAGIGSGTAGYIISGHYDINYNRALTCAYLIGGSAIAGALGGALGGLVGYLSGGATSASTSKPGFFETFDRSTVVTEGTNRASTISNVFV